MQLTTKNNQSITIYPKTKHHPNHKIHHKPNNKNNTTINYTQVQTQNSKPQLQYKIQNNQATKVKQYAQIKNKQQLNQIQTKHPT